MNLFSINKINAKEFGSEKIEVSKKTGEII